LPPDMFLSFIAFMVFPDPKKLPNSCFHVANTIGSINTCQPFHSQP
jgi:hypothetical protein